MLRCDSSSRWSTLRSTSCHTKRVDSRRRATRASAHRTNEPRSHTHQSRSQRRAHRTLQVDTTTSARRCIWLTREVNQHPHDSQPHLAPTPSPRIANRNESLRGNNGELSSSRSCAIYTMRDCSSANALRHESRYRAARRRPGPRRPVGIRRNRFDPRRTTIARWRDGWQLPEAPCACAALGFRSISRRWSSGCEIRMPTRSSSSARPGAMTPTHSWSFRVRFVCHPIARADARNPS